MSNGPGRGGAAIQRALLMAKSGPLTVSETAKVLGLPGPWTVRRLEQRGAMPAAQRSLAMGHRMYQPDRIAAIRRAIQPKPSEDSR